MKSVGMVRKLDQLGRIVLPKETRKRYKINEGNSLEIFVEDDRIILKKYIPGCIFCGDIENIKEYKGKRICINCAVNISIKVTENIY